MEDQPPKFIKIVTPSEYFQDGAITSATEFSMNPKYFMFAIIFILIIVLLVKFLHKK